MIKPCRLFLLVSALLLAAILSFHRFSTRPGASSPAAVAAVRVEAAPPLANQNPTVRLRPDQVLVTVNGRRIELRDIVPISGNETQRDLEISAHDMKYLLKRAVDRELIFQAAQKWGVQLNDSQNQQLANYDQMRRQPEPGGIASLNVNPAQQELEMQDSKAFLLQTSLMADQGASPNVTEDQVMGYYQAHQAEFDALPADETARQQAWAKIDFAIREQLTATVRASYNEKLAAYMNQVESSATIVTTPLASLSQNN